MNYIDFKKVQEEVRELQEETFNDAKVNTEEYKDNRLESFILYAIFILIAIAFAKVIIDLIH